MGPLPEWVVGVGDVGTTSGLGATRLRDRSVVLCGLNEGQIVLGRGTPQETTLPGNGNTSLFLARHDRDGVLEWVRSVTGTGYVRGYGASVLPDDGVVFPADDCAVAGFFVGTATFDDGQGGTTQLVASGLEDGFVAKYSSKGVLRWLRRIGGELSYDEVLAVAGLPNGSVAVTGLFTGPLTLGAGEPNETTLTTTSLECFVACFDELGNLLWARQTTSASDSYATGWAITAAPGLGVVVGGEVLGTTTLGLGDAGETTMTSTAGEDAWIARFDAAGEVTWASRIGGPEEDEILGLAVASDGRVFATGYFRGATDVDADGVAPVSLTSNGPLDGFVVALTAAGAAEWAHAFGGAADDVGLAAVALGDGSVVVGGRTLGASVLDADLLQPLADPTDPSGLSPDAFLARFGADGSLVWARTAGGEALDLASSVSWDPIDHTLYLAGSFMGAARFDAGGSATPLPLSSAGPADAFLARFRDDGGE